ncbi:MAG: N-acetyl-gamma-glutamyl-phosphate reductase [Syntrophomonadaceae bacterium]|nr:N-acetyl-gamma-glutamyl-phosphate reductase [Syntrophomonadaceae bacterium]
MYKVGIIGATGYTGFELTRILSRHPDIKLEALTSQSYEGKSAADVYPSLTGYVDAACEAPEIAGVVFRCDVVFVALPHGHAVPVALEVYRQGKKMVDLGADFRFSQAAIYQQWYGLEHQAPELLRQTVYGLPEINRQKIREAHMVANPGCYPTSAILALAPALAAGMIRLDSIVIDAKSGISGAGRNATIGSLFSEVNESVQPYNVACHRHTPEIEQALSQLAVQEVTVSFTPHLIPMTRGILSTVYASLDKKVTTEEVRGIYQSYYSGEPFVQILPDGQWPRTKSVSGSNHCHLNLTVDRRTGRLVVAAVIDNLVKGAAGQGVQNMNLMLGLPETTGLDFCGMYL